MGSLKLLYAANPRLFSDLEYDRYPTSYDELSVLLKREQVHQGSELVTELATELDYLDSILFEDKDKGIDVEKKLRVEYALFKASAMARAETAVEGPTLRDLQSWSEQIESARVDPAYNKTLKMQDDFYRAIVCFLRSVALDQDTLQAVIKAGNLGHESEDFDKSLSGSRQLHQSQLDEVTSYLISGALQRGIDLKPKLKKTESVRDDVAFFKDCIDSLLSNINSQQIPKEESDSLDSESSDTAVAFKDLQLAHNFLTKKFEDDRNEYLHSIDKLTRTNKELSHELLTYHSKISSLKDACDDLTKKNEQLKANVEPASTAIMMSPTSSPSSVTSGGAPYSISAMRNEFKRVLTDTQVKYEKELQKERDSRRRLERELEALKQHRAL